MIAAISLLGAVVVAYLGWNLYTRVRADRLAQFSDRRRDASRMVCRGEFVDGNRHLEVALAVTESTLFYENADMEASLDLQRIREIEYDTELATGSVVAGGQVLRLRSDSQTFEFVVPSDSVARWQLALPSRGARPGADARQH